MKLKKLFIGALLALSVFFIYLSTVDKKIYYLNLGDSFALGMTPYETEDYGYSDFIKDDLKEKGVLEKYVTEFAQREYCTTDLLRDIKDNKKIGKITLKNALIKADLVTLSIGFLDLYSRIDRRSLVSGIDYNQFYQYAEEALIDLDSLFQLMREYCKEDIVMIGYYNPNISETTEEHEFYLSINSRLEKLCEKYNLIFIDTYEIFKENQEQFLPNPENIYPSKKGYEAISKQILVKLEQNLLK